MTSIVQQPVSGIDIGRRRFMTGAAGFTFGLATGLPLLGSTPGAAHAATEGNALSPWVTSYSDGTIAILSPAAEMGPGSLTSLPLILAAELDSDSAKVPDVSAPP